MRLPATEEATRLGVIGLAFLAACALYWSGVGENDAFRYIDGALNWLQNGPQIGETHWTLRTPLIAPIAASFAIFGPGEFAAVLPNIVYAGLLVFATYFMSRNYWGSATALWIALSTVVSAFLIGMQIELSATGAELFFAAMSCWLFADGMRGKPQSLMLAGLFAGGAWLCRETNAFLPLAFMIVAALRPPPRVVPMVQTLAPLAAVIAAEMLFYAVAAGDPFYRYITDMGHRGEGGVYADLKTRNPVFIEWFARPLLYFLSDPAATPAFLLGGIAMFNRNVRTMLFQGEGAIAGRTFAVAAVTSFLLSSYVLNVKWPSYYSIAAYAAGIAIGVGLAALAKARGLRWAIAAFAGWSLINFAADDFRAYGEIEEARRLAALVAETGEAVTADHVTAVRAQSFLRMRGLDPAMVRSSLDAPPTCGRIFVANPVERSLAIAVDPEWRLLRAEAVRERRLTHAIFARTNLQALSPRLGEIIAPPKPVSLYDAGPCGPSG